MGMQDFNCGSCCSVGFRICIIVIIKNNVDNYSAYTFLILLNSFGVII